MLSDEQIDHFKIFGFVVLRQLLSPEETRTIQAEFERGRVATLKSAPNAGSASLTQWSNLKPESPFIAGLLEDPRFCGAAEQLLGDDCVAVYTNSNRRGGDTHWHPDTPDPSIRGFKFTTYLRSLSADTGALRVVPGSHVRPFHDEVSRAIETCRLALADVPFHVCAVEPGDVIAFDMRLFHAAKDPSEDRRQLTFCYLADPETPEERKAVLQLAREMAATHRHTGAPPPHYHPDWLANPQASARRQLWIERIGEWGLLEASDRMSSPELCARPATSRLAQAGD